MEGNKRDNFRDCKSWKDENLSLSTSSNECAKLYDAALTQYVGWFDNDSFGGLEKTLNSITSEDPSFVLGHALNVGLELIGTGSTVRLNSDLASSVEKLVNLSTKQSAILTSREKNHVRAIQLFSEGRVSQASYIWEDILMDHPTDMLAIKFAHDSYFYQGKQDEVRDSIARVLPFWKDHIPLYSYLYGMYSFGLVETNFYDKAEHYAKKGLEMNSNDAWSTHSLAHVYEMSGRQDEGISFLSKTVSDWQPCGMLACHNFWHWAVYHIEKGEFEAALDLYDYRIGKMVKESQGAMLDIVDAASLLYRLQLGGLNPGKERWDEIYRTAVPHLDDHILLFNDAHLLMSFLGSENITATKKFLKSLKSYVENFDEDNSKICRDFGIDLLDGMVAYNEGRFDDAVQSLFPIRKKFVQAGGSDAQRDVFNLLLINSALKSDSHTNVARSLLNERKALRDKSPLTDRLISCCLSKHQQN